MGEPGHANSVADSESDRTLPELIDDADHLVTGNDQVVPWH
jgi:hypothetical protein